MATVNYDINYDDSRFKQVESAKTEALSDLEETYAGMVNESDKFYQAQIDASKQWADKQSQLQQEQSDFAIEQIEQQKDQAHKDYIKEQSGAYVDWRKQSNEYGPNAEEMASAGLTNTGYSESSQVSMYNTYQNRVATAREAYGRAVLNYDNAIKDARLQNNAALAEIAFEALQQQLELSLQGFQYKNTLVLDKVSKKTEMERDYYNRYQDVLQQINTENALAEEVRQYNEKMAEEIRQYNESMALEKEKLAEEKRQYNESMAFEREQFEYTKEKSSGGGSGKSFSMAVPTKIKAAKDKNGGLKIEDTSGREVGINIDSAIKAGLSGRSGDYIADQVAKGNVKATQKGNQIYLERNKTFKASSLIPENYLKMKANKYKG